MTVALPGLLIWSVVAQVGALSVRSGLPKAKVSSPEIMICLLLFSKSLMMRLDNVVKVRSEIN